MRAGQVATRAGVGLRLPHLAEAVAARPDVGWFEVHPENFLANAHARELLLALRDRYPVSIHTVGISVGSAEGVDRAHLQRLRAFVDEIDPLLVSGHLAWSTHGAAYLNDLLPLPYTEESLRVVAAHVAQVQDVLARPYLVENPARYGELGTSTMTEAEFLHELVRRSGCLLLCDVSNVHLSAHNIGGDARAYLDALPAAAIAELHLGGFTPEPDEEETGATLLIDTHASPVAAQSWDLYAHAIRRFGALPTLIEWDNDLPDLGSLAAEAHTAERVSAAARGLHVAG
jgi:uncharacterized protein (UPF0276 family)